MSRRKLQLLSSAFLAVAAMLVFFIGMGSQTKVNADGTFEVLNNSTKLSAGYGHTPVMNKDTRVITGGSESWSNSNSITLNYFDLAGTHVTSALSMYPSTKDVTHSYGRNKPTVTYTHVLNDNGKWLDLRITINGYRRNSNSIGLDQIGAIVFSRNAIQQLHVGYDYVDETWQYVDSEGHAQPINGYMTFTDIDTYQNIEFDKDSSSRISRAIVPTKSTTLFKDSDDQGGWGIYTHTYKNLADSDPTTRIMVAYNDPHANGITFKYGTDYQALLGTNYVGHTIWDTRTMFGYSYVPITSSTPSGGTYAFDDPSKYALVNGSETKSGSVSDTNSNLNWKVHQNIPYNTGTNISNFKETDSLPQATSYVDGSMKVTDEYGVDRSNWFTVSSSNGKLYMIATSAALRDASFYNNSFTFSFATKINVNDGPVVDGSNFRFTNTANLTANGENYGPSSATITTPGNVTATITVNHYDKRTGELLKSDKYNPNFLLSKGYDYDYKYDSTLKKHLNDRDIPYKLVSTPNEYRGHLSKGGNYTFNFYYEAGLLEAGVKKVTIPTVPSTSDMTVHANLSTNLGYDNQDAANKNSKITVNLTDQNTGKVVQSKDYTLATLPSSIDFTVPKNSLNAGEHHSFKVSFSNYDSNDVYIWSDNLATDGYAAQQGTINASVHDTDKTWTGVVQTYHVYNDNMKVQHESIHIPILWPDEFKTGFGVSLDTNITYQNDLGDDISKSTNSNRNLFDYSLPADTEATPLTYRTNSYRIKLDRKYQVANNKVTIDGTSYDASHGYITYDDNQYDVKSKDNSGNTVAKYVEIPRYYPVSNIQTTKSEFWTNITSGDVTVDGTVHHFTTNVRLNTDGSVITHDEYINYKGNRVAIVNGRLYDSFMGVNYRIVGDHVYTDQKQSYLIRKGTKQSNDANVADVGTGSIEAGNVTVNSSQSITNSTTTGTNGETAAEDSISITTPNTSVEKYTGLVLTDEQLSNLKQIYNIQTVAGNNKWYLPFWDTLGRKPYNIQSKQTLGVNQMTVNISSYFDVYANFIGYNGSSTIKNDQFVFQPQSDLNNDGAKTAAAGGSTSTYKLD